MTIIRLRLKFQLLKKKTLWIGSERNSLRRNSGQLLGYLFYVAPLVVIKPEASELECIYLQNWQSSPHINPPIELCWNEMIWENSLQISFFSATLSRTQRISSTLSIFSSERMLKRGEWVGDCFWGTIGFFLRGREEQEGNSRRSIVFARQAPRWQQHLSLVHS